jgi:hypothetical protein
MAVEWTITIEGKNEFGDVCRKAVRIDKRWERLFDGDLGLSIEDGEAQHFQRRYKRLTEDKFRWPRREATVVTLTTEQLHWVLDGIDIDAMVRHPVRQYQVAG